MSVVTFVVETADNFLKDSAETQFGAIASTVGSIMVLSMTLLVILVLINMSLQYRSMDGRQAFWLAVKLTLVGVFATNWVQFNSFASAVLDGIDSIAGSLVASVGGGSPGPSGTFAEEFDGIIEEFGVYLNVIGDNMHWMVGALMGATGTFLLSALGAIAAFFMIASRVMIALLLGIAPIMIFLTLFDVTKDYFSRWLSALISFAIYPVVIAGVFATIIGVSNALISELGDPRGIETIGSFVPFLMMIFMAKGFLLATPLLVRSISGNIMMPALSGGLVGAKDFAVGASGNQQAKARELMGTASFGERAGLRLNRALAGTTAHTASGPQATGTGQQMQRIQARSDRLRGK